MHTSWMRNGIGRMRNAIGPAMLLMLIGGCVDSPPGRITETQELRDKLEAQQRLVVARDEQIQQQAKIVQELQGLSGERTLDRLVHVQGIELATLSGGYDDNRDGIDEGVVAYLSLRDQEGDLIKATGSVHVRLLDLANPPEGQLIGETRLGPAELRPLWYGRGMTYHYTIKVLWLGGAGRAPHKTVTVLVSFTELLSGRTFDLQKAVEVTGAGG
jgi:hypothetical protein